MSKIYCEDCGERRTEDKPVKGYCQRHLREHLAARPIRNPIIKITGAGRKTYTYELTVFEESGPRIRRGSAYFGEPVEIDLEQPCGECGGSREVSTEEQVYAGEPHIVAPIGTKPCPACRPKKELAEE